MYAHQQAAFSQLDSFVRWGLRCPRRKARALNKTESVEISIMEYSKTCVKRPLSKRSQIGLKDQLLLNAGQKYCRMLQGEHSAILSTVIKLPFVIKIFVLSIILSGCFTQIVQVDKVYRRGNI